MPITARRSAALLAVSLAATLGTKALSTEFNAAEDYARLDRDISRRLEEKGFAYTERKEVARPPTFYASRGDCRLVVRQATEPAGFDRKYRQNAQGTGPMHYRIGHERFENPPLLRLWIGDKLQQARIRLGFAAPRAPALAVAMSSDCPADALPTHDLLVHPETSREQG